MNRELSFGGELFSKYHSGFKVIFEISFGEYRILIRRSGYFLSINRGLRLFVKSNKVNRVFIRWGGHFLSIIRVLRLFLNYTEVNREPSIGGEAIF